VKAGECPIPAEKGGGNDPSGNCPAEDVQGEYVMFRGMYGSRREGTGPFSVQVSDLMTD